MLSWVEHEKSFYYLGAWSVPLLFAYIKVSFSCVKVLHVMFTQLKALSGLMMQLDDKIELVVIFGYNVV